MAKRRQPNANAGLSVLAGPPTLSGIVERTKELAAHIVGPWAQLLIAESDRAVLAGALAEAEEDGALEELRAAASAPANRSKLKACGLAGKQVAAKLWGFFGAWNALVTLGGVWRLMDVIEWIKLILGSLASALGPVGEVVKELIEVIDRFVRKATASSAS